MLWKRFVIADKQRGLVTKNGRFGGIFPPGEYAMFVPSDVSLKVERHDLANIVFRSNWTEFLVRKRPDLVERHFKQVRTNDVQVAMVYVNGRLFQVLTPRKRLLLWRDAGEVTSEVVDVISRPTGPIEEAAAAVTSKNKTRFELSPENDAATCLFFIHSRLARARTPGKYGEHITAQEISILTGAAGELFDGVAGRMQTSIVTAATSLMRKAREMDSATPRMSGPCDGSRRSQVIPLPVNSPKHPISRMQR
ncbi:MAG: hypothetical protein JO319_12465 [Acidobacteriaceae bacterium]|nr:hypothetical protein [Acidobacteriaceae bacterium]